MPRVRTRADEARYTIYMDWKRLHASGNRYPTLDEVIAGNPTFEEALYHLTKEHILSIPDQDAIMIAEHTLDDDWRLTADYLFSAVPGFFEEDVFFTEASQAPIATESAVIAHHPAEPGSLNAHPPAGAKRGRKVANWWPEFAARLAFDLHNRGYTESQEKMVNRTLEAFADRPDCPSPSAIKPAIAELYRLKRMDENSDSA